jgi:hypothetical protein
MSWQVSVTMQTEFVLDALDRPHEQMKGTELK